MAIKNAVIGNTVTEILKPTNDSAVVSIIFFNNHTTTVNLTLYAYPSGGSAGAGSTILTLDMPTKSCYNWTGDEKLLLETDDVISAVASVNGVITSTINYLEV